VIRIRLMTAADVRLGMRLKEQAGWNQTEADWRRFLALEPDGCFVAELGGVPAGTLTTCIFGPVAWIAMVLVDEPLRGRGLAKALLAHALAFLDGRGVRTVRLDATDLGRPLYEKLGFVVEYQLARYQGVLPDRGTAPRPPGVCPQPLVARHLEGIVRLDRAVTGSDRGKLLLRLLVETPSAAKAVQDGGEVTGFVLGRLGARAAQIGPCVATGDAGPVLLRDAWWRYGGRRVFGDIPTGNTAAVALAEAAGLAVQRHFLRMCRGPSVGERTAELWISSGPEKG
jgi:GNAT superfamily N-acetyltransferase